MEIREIPLIDLTKQYSKQKIALQTEQEKLRNSLATTANKLLSLQHEDGYWWFTLQANEAIGAQYIFLQNFVEDIDVSVQEGICQRLLDVQRADGSWSLYQDGPVHLSSTIECYLALKIAGYNIDSPPMRKAREIILEHGGLIKATIFTRIHLAMFGLIPWKACPEMPPELILLPNWFPINIYEFSSWARSCIVPLLIFISLKPVHKLSFNLDELYVEPEGNRDFSFKRKKSLISKDTFFIYLDKFLKVYEYLPLKPLRNSAINNCSEWTWKHIQHAVDIYPALAYAALAFKAMGFSKSSAQISTAMRGLKSFHQNYPTRDIPAVCYPIKNNNTNGLDLQDIITKRVNGQNPVHQQCCISPVWDTPWSIMSLLDAGIPANDPALLKAGRWLISKQITDFKGDWAIKNPHTQPGGWSFEFKNDCFPDVDDTIEVVAILQRLALPEVEKQEPIRKAVAWMLSMQNDDGGWGAFDKNQTLNLVNEIPFSDHKACLDPSTPDITGRMIEVLADMGMTTNDEPIAKALKFLENTCEPFGGWFGRWGVNYIYGTWCVLAGLSELGWNPLGKLFFRATNWLKSIQNLDGGFGESPESYSKHTYIKWKESTASQTAWALMGLVAGGQAKSSAAKRAARYLTNTINENNTWDETAYTGTGFPGHFYIRYHGYRHYFPILALARYYNAIKT
ncbi:MAG: prenyltransferase/squalene oxidase repeat-containing protein [Pseudomonadota bacterium]